MGSDLLDSFITWEGWAQIMEWAPPIVVNRSGYSTPTPLNLGHSLILPDISSTAVKAAMQAGENISQLMPREVLAYIKEHKLYDQPG